MKKLLVILMVLFISSMALPQNAAWFKAKIKNIETLQTTTTTNVTTNATAISNITDGTTPFTDVITSVGEKMVIVVVTDTATYDILATNTGKVHVIPNMTANSSFVLPTEVAGLYYEFIYIGGATEAHDHTFDSENDTNYVIGGINWVDMGTDSVEILSTSIYSDGNSNSKLTVNNIAAGTILNLYCDGTNWYVYAIIYSDTTPAFADQ